jgi:hypothetical protein
MGEAAPPVGSPSADFTRGHSFEEAASDDTARQFLVVLMIAACVEPMTSYQPFFVTMKSRPSYGLANTPIRMVITAMVAIAAFVVVCIENLT